MNTAEWDSLLNRLLFRSWYYFRVGYATYLTFPIGFFSTIVTVYYLAIRNIPGLEQIFPRFLVFCVLAATASVPLSVLLGWIHVKRSRAWTSEMDVTVEANPYNYKLAPGYYKEVLFPLYRELLIGTTQLLDEQGLMDSSRRKRLEELRSKMDLLLRGGSVGLPSRRLEPVATASEKTA